MKNNLNKTMLFVLAIFMQICTSKLEAQAQDGSNAANAIPITPDNFASTETHALPANSSKWFSFTAVQSKYYFNAKATTGGNLNLQYELYRQVGSAASIENSNLSQISSNPDAQLKANNLISGQVYYMRMQNTSAFVQSVNIALTTNLHTLPFGCNSYGGIGISQFSAMTGGTTTYNYVANNTQPLLNGQYKGGTTSGINSNILQNLDCYVFKAQNNQTLFNYSFSSIPNVPYFLALCFFNYDYQTGNSNNQTYTLGLYINGVQTSTFQIDINNQPRIDFRKYFYSSQTTTNIEIRNISAADNGKYIMLAQGQHYLEQYMSVNVNDIGGACDNKVHVRYITPPNYTVNIANSSNNGIPLVFTETTTSIGNPLICQTANAIVTETEVVPMPLLLHQQVSNATTAGTINFDLIMQESNCDGSNSYNYDFPINFTNGCMDRVLFCLNCCNTNTITQVCNTLSNSNAYGSNFSTSIWNNGVIGASIPINSAGVYSAVGIMGFSIIQDYYNSYTVTPQSIGIITQTGNTLNALYTGATAYSWSTGASTSSITICTNGTYTCTMSKPGCPDVIRTITVTNLTAAATITQNTSTGLATANFANAVTWVWKNSAGITVATTQTYTPSVAGNYTCTVTNSNGCSSVASANLVVPNPCFLNNVVLNNVVISNFTSNSTNYTVQGTLTLNGTATLNTCLFFMTAGSKIILQNSATLNINNTSFTNCTNMWQGIELKPGAILNAVSGTNSITGAEIAVNVTDYTARAILRSVKFNNNYVGVKINGPTEGQRINNSSITYCTFNCPGALPNPHSGMLNPIDQFSFADVWTIGVSNVMLSDNSYKNSYIGLLTENSKLYPRREVFNDMKVSGTYNNFVLNSNYGFILVGRLGGGIGILTSGTGLSNQFVKFINTGNSSVDALSQAVDFNKCNFGAVAINSGLHLENHCIKNTNHGVYMNKNSSFGNIITHVGMEVSNFGIHADTQSGNGPVIFANNHIKLTLPSNMNAGGILFGGVNGTFSNDLIIDNNLIKINDNSQVGISVSSINGSLSHPGYSDYRRLVTDNKVYYTGNSIAANNLNSAIKSNGIILNNTQYTTLGCNDVQSLDGSIAHSINAYSINSSTNNKLTCNNANYTSAGFSFKNICGSTEFKGNTMNEHRNGVFVGNNGIMGQNFNRGNVWQSANYGNQLGTYLGTPIYQRAGYNDNSGANANTNIIASQFRNNNNTNSGNAYYEPLSIPNANGVPYDVLGFWFGTNSLTNNTNCTSNPNPNTLPQNTGVQCYSISSNPALASISFNSVDENFAQYYVLMNNFEQINNWYADRAVFEKLLDKPELKDNDPDAAQFYNDALTRSFAKLSVTDRLLHEALAYSEADRTTIEGLKQANESIATQVEGWQIQLEQDPENEAILALIEALSQQYLGNQTIEKNIETNKESVEWQKTQDALNELAQVQSMGRLYVENDKQINEIISRTIARDLDITDEADWSIIYTIANQCPFDGGNAVYVARDLYAQRDLDKLYEYNDCSGSGNQRKAYTAPQHFDPEEQAAKEGKNLNSELALTVNPLMVYPNPANDVLVISGLDACKNPIIQLMDASGKAVINQSISYATSIYKISVANFAPGLYTLKVSDSNAGSFVQKVSIAH